MLLSPIAPSLQYAFDLRTVSWKPWNDLLRTKRNTNLRPDQRSYDRDAVAETRHVRKKEAYDSTTGKQRYDSREGRSGAPSSSEYVLDRHDPQNDESQSPNHPCFAEFQQQDVVHRKCLNSAHHCLVILPHDRHERIQANTQEGVSFHHVPRS